MDTKGNGLDMKPLKGQSPEPQRQQQQQQHHLHDDVDPFYDITSASQQFMHEGQQQEQDLSQYPYMYPYQQHEEYYPGYEAVSTTGGSTLFVSPSDRALSPGSGSDQPGTGSDPPGFAPHSYLQRRPVGASGRKGKPKKTKKDGGRTFCAGCGGEGWNDAWNYAWNDIWNDAWNMYVFFVFGLACAVGHHIFYSALHGRPATAQLQMLRYGTMLAFAAKAGLSAAAVCAFRQRVWTTVRTRFMSVAAIDSLFAATEDLIALANFELFQKAWRAVFLALFVWLAPLIVILTANTLLVQQRTVEEIETCPGVRTLNFTKEDVNDWRVPGKIDGLYTLPLSLWNTTKRPDDPDDGDWFDYYTAPALHFDQTATLGAFLQEVVPRRNASIETCGPGWNCTFAINFIGPGYQCTELASGIGSSPANLTQESGSIAAPFGTDILLPKGTHAYYAYTTGGEYSSSQMEDVQPGGIPVSDPPYPRSMGAFRTEPVLWIGYAVVTDLKPLPNLRTDPDWDKAFVPKIFACEHRVTNYTVQFNYTDATQQTTIVNRTFLEPIVNTTFVPGVDANDGTADNITAVPSENYILPSDVGRYRRTAAYHAMGAMLREFINGTVQVGENLFQPMANTNAIQTRLINPRDNFFPYADLQERMQSFYEDIILSIFSNPSFAAVVWAAKPGEQSGTLVKHRNETSYYYPCTRTRTANVYAYHRRVLWIVYGIGISLALLCVMAGAVALAENGGEVRNTRFSSVVTSTRGEALDKVRWEGRYEVVSKERLGYGVLIDAKTNEGRFGFGLERDVKLVSGGGHFPGVNLLRRRR